jgi:hypothetical protein
MNGPVSARPLGRRVVPGSEAAADAVADQGTVHEKNSENHDVAVGNSIAYQKVCSGWRTQQLPKQFFVPVRVPRTLQIADREEIGGQPT